jgi:alkanesulfonate monooxygenase SsuD/methylene tetrahydromethanopterin reductase-like flavin-dependent oxidoreductase (luciferase family)
MGGEARSGILILQNDPWPAILERAQRYESLGFDTVWVADSFVDPWEPSRPWLECWTLLAALAIGTSRIRLGPLVTHPTYRNPAVIARQAMTVDHISNGRLELGLGSGASEHDWTTTTGGPSPRPRERVRRFQEMLEIVDLLLREERASYRGEQFSITDAWMRPGPVQRPRPPLSIAANGPKMVQLAARLADTWITEGAYTELWNTGATFDDVVRVTRERGALLDRTAAELGRPPEAIRRAFLFGYSPAEDKPWRSVEAFREYVDAITELGFSEFVFPEPSGAESATFEQVVEDLTGT